MSLLCYTMVLERKYSTTCISYVHSLKLLWAVWSLSDLSLWIHNALILWQHKPVLNSDIVNHVSDTPGSWKVSLQHIMILKYASNEYWFVYIVKLLGKSIDSRRHFPKSIVIWEFIFTHIITYVMFLLFFCRIGQSLSHRLECILSFNSLCYHFPSLHSLVLAWQQGR